MLVWEERERMSVERLYGVNDLPSSHEVAMGTDGSMTVAKRLGAHSRSMTW